MVPQYQYFHCWILWLPKKIPVAVMENFDSQGHLTDQGGEYGSLIFNWFLNHMKKIDPAKKVSGIFMLDGA